jgi:MFS family permease
VRHALRALRHRNFRLFLGGQIISVVGTWMQQVALNWLVYRLSGSAFLLGLVGFAGQIPTLFLSPLAGVWADRWNRHRMVIATQLLSMAQALALAALAFAHVTNVWPMVALSFFLGLVNAVDVPARQSFLVEMVNGREDLANAIALNSSMFNLARLVGPAIAGVLIGFVGEGVVFLLNGLSYLAVIAALLAMRLHKRPPSKASAPDVRARLAEGFRYAWNFRPIRAILLLVGVVSMMGVPYNVLLPIFATEVLHGGAHTYGFLVGATGVGALFGALFLAARPTVRGLGRIIVLSVLLFGSGLVAFSFSRNEWLSVALLLIAGFGLMTQMASSNTILQTIVDEGKRGRVMSLYTVAFMGMIPFGSLLTGAVAGPLGAPTTVRLGGAACILGALAFARALPSFREEVRPIYARLGIIPEMAVGVPPEPPDS